MLKNDKKPVVGFTDFDAPMKENLKKMQGIEEKFLSLDNLERAIIFLLEKANEPLNAFTIKVSVWEWQTWCKGGFALVVPANITNTEKELKKKGKTEKIGLTSQNKIDYCLQNLMILKLVDKIVKGKRDFFKLNPSFLIDWRNAKHAFYEKLDGGLLNPFAVSTFEKQLYSFELYPYLGQKEKKC